MVESNTTSLASTNVVARRIGRLRERIELDALGIGDGLGDVGVAAALQHRAQQGVALIGVRRHRDVAGGHFVRVVAGRQNQVLAALALVHAAGSDILDGGLPVVHDAAVEHAVVGRRNLQHHRADVLRVDERHQIDHVGIRRERLVLPVEQARPVENLVEAAFDLADHLLVHEVVVDRRHAPDHRLDGAALDAAAGQIFGGEILRMSQESAAKINASAARANLFMALLCG